MIQAIQRPQLRHGATRRESQRIDLVRVFGYSSALAANLIAAGLLVMPLQAPPPPLRALETPPTWIIPVQPEPLPPVVTPPLATVTPNVERPRPITPTVPVVSPNVDVPVIVDVAGIPTMDTIEIHVEPSVAPPSTAVGAAPMQLEYAHAPPPPYPREHLRNGDEGVVLLQVLVDVDGRPLQVDIAEGSGHRGLDRAAQRHVLANWRFQPAMRDGQAVQAIGLVPIEFSLR